MNKRASSRCRRLAALAAGVAATLALVQAAGVTPAARRGPQVGGSQSTELDVVQIRPNFYLIAGAGSNVALAFGSDGSVVVDAGSNAQADRVVSTIKALTTQPIRYVIDTSADADHVGGNATVAKAGQTLFVVGNDFANAMTNGGAAAVLAAERVLTKMSAPTGQASPYPAAAWPTETFAQPRKYMYLNQEGIEVLHQPSAHSDGDSIVFFRRSDVVVAGDIIDTRRFPVIDVADGGSVQGEVAALNRIIELAIPSVPLVSHDGGTAVIPGHGRVYDQTDVVEYRDMVTIVRDRVQALLKQGKTLNEIKAATPAKGYTRQYGSDSAWTADMFVEAVYASLTQRPQQR